MIEPAEIDAFANANNHAALDQRQGLALDREVATFSDALAVNPLRAATDKDGIFVALRHHEFRRGDPAVE